MITGFILLVLIFILIFLSVPVAFALGAVATIGVFLLHGNPMQIIPQSIYSGINYFPLLAIPFFILMGELMNAGGITEKLVKFANLLVGRLPAGLAHTNIFACMFFGGITGSAPADTSAIGGLLIPAMEKEGYPLDFSAALTASASTMGPIIPPSIIMVIYGSTVGVSIGALFAGGIVPGVLIACGLMITVLIINSVRKFPRRTKSMPIKDAVEIIKGAIWPLGMPVIVLGGIVGGIFTATEAGAAGVLYSLIIGFFILKTLKIKMLIPMIRHTAILTATVLLIIGTARILGVVFTVLRVQVGLGQFFMQVSNNPLVFLLLVNILLLLIGTFMDAGASIILLAPILFPLAVSLGIDPVHFGLIMVINLTIGHATPPLGLCLFVACGISKQPLEKVSRAIVPFLTAELCVLLLVTYFPQLCLYLPKMLGYV